MNRYGNMSTSYATFDGLSSAEFVRSQPAYSFQESITPYTHAEDLSFVSPSISHGTRHSGYEDGFPDSAHERSSPEAPSIERGNELLCFQTSTPTSAVLDFSLRQSSVSLSAQLHGMFFLAESSRTGTGELIASPPELTCYRRNLFQITGSVTLPRSTRCVLTERGEQLPIKSQELCISATESVEGSSVKIISVPWKTPANGAAPSPEDKAEKEPSSIPLDQATNHDLDSDFTVCPIAWKRLQFRVATANNGRRRELQQHFTVKLSVVATLTSGSRITLCEALSGPIIVRGRSPRNFQARKDVPLSGSGASMRKSIPSVSPSIRRSSTADSMHARGSKVDTGSDMMYTLSPSEALRRNSPTAGFEWQSAQPVTAPVSPYTEASPEMATAANQPPKRKSDDSILGGLQLTIPQNTGFSAQRSSAPPQDRPRKISRTRLNTAVGASGAYLQGQAATAMPSIPTTSFAFSPSLPAPNLYSNGLPKPNGSEATELVNDIFSIDQWLTSADTVYRPHGPQATHIPSMTSVGGPAFGDRGYYGDDMA